MIFQFYKRRLLDLLSELKIDTNPEAIQNIKAEELFSTLRIPLTNRSYAWYFSKFKEHLIVLEKYIEGYSIGRICKETKVRRWVAYKILNSYGFAQFGKDFLLKDNLLISRNAYLLLYMYIYLNEFPFMSNFELSKILRAPEMVITGIRMALYYQFPHLKENRFLVYNSRFKLYVYDKRTLKISDTIAVKLKYVKINGLDIPVLRLWQMLVFLGISKKRYKAYVRRKYLPPPIVVIDSKAYMTIYEYYAYLYAKLSYGSIEFMMTRTRLGKIRGNKMNMFFSYMWNRYFYIKDCLKRGVYPTDIPYVIAFKSEDSLRKIISKILLSNNIINPKLLDDLVKGISLFQTNFQDNQQ